MALMPVGGLLPCISQMQELRFGEVFTKKLQTDWTTVRMDAAGHGNAGQTGKRSRNRIKVREVGGNRIGISPKIVSRTSGNRTSNGIDLTESLMEFTRNEATNFLSL